MNILFIGPYRQQDGWGDAAIAYIRALKTTGNNLAIKSIYLASNLRAKNDEDILQLEKNKFDYYDIIIQNTLPNFFWAYPDSKNIGLLHLEANSIKYSTWVGCCNQMNEIWVPSRFERNCLSMELEVPVRSVPVPLDTDKVSRTYEPLALTHIPDKHFKFYFIGDYIQRKNFAALIIAYNREFRAGEPVALVLKANINPQQIQQDIERLKTNLRLYQDMSCYPNETIIAMYLSDEDMMKLHSACDCFVMPSSGESTCIPALEAMGMGNPVITNKNTGTSEFIDESNGWLVNSREVPIIIDNPPIPEVYNAHHTWNDIDVIDLQKAMRSAFNLRKCPNILSARREYSKNYAQKYSYENIGKLMSEIL